MLSSYLLKIRFIRGDGDFLHHFSALHIHQVHAVFLYGTGLSCLQNDKSASRKQEAQSANSRDQHLPPRPTEGKSR